MRRRCCCGNCKLSANFSYEVIPPFTVKFTDLSSSDVAIIRWSWDFGDGTTSSEQNPTHTYPGSGLYVATLEVEDSRGCIRSITYPIVFDYVNCTSCIEPQLPRFISATIQNGTSPINCLECLNIGGTYILENVGGNSCRWRYQSPNFVCANVCNTPRISFYIIEFSFDNSGLGPRRLELSINFTTTSSVIGEICKTFRGTYTKNVSFPILCLGTHELARFSGAFNTGCAYPALTASVTV